MKIDRLALMTALLAAMAAVMSPVLAEADTAAPPMAAAASSARDGGPQLPTPAQQRDNATAPDLRPEQAATQQLTIPLGKPAVLSRPPETDGVRRGTAASAAGIGGIDDRVARCEAQSSAPERAACRARLAHETKPPG